MSFVTEIVSAIKGTSTPLPIDPPRPVRVSWLLDEDSGEPIAYTDLWPKGSVLRLDYTPAGGRVRSVLLIVVGPRRKVGPDTCLIQTREQPFRALEKASAGSVMVQAKRIA